MATVNPTRLFASRNLVLGYEWVLTESDTAVEVEMPWNSDKSIQVSGDFGSGGDVRLGGSLDPARTTFADLRDPQGNLIQITSADLVAVMENAFYIRPRVAAGTGVSVTVRVLAR